MNPIVQTLISQSFIGNILLLLVAAALTGLLVPIIKARIDNKSSQRQKLFEADLARQGDLMNYQTKLLDDLEEVLWEYQFLALEPTYYKERGNEKGYEVAIQQYDQKAPILLGKIRIQISKVRRFASPETYQTFSHLYYQQLIPLDGWLIELFETGASSRGDWIAHHKFSYTVVGDEIDKALYLLAKDFGLLKNMTISPS